MTDHLAVDELWIGRGEPLSHVHLAFQATACEIVHRFYAAALAVGGRDNGAPGERYYHPGYYAALVFDPTATTSRPSITGRRTARLRPW